MLILFMKKQFQMEFARNFILFYVFFKMLRQHFFPVFKPNYLENLRGYPQFSFWILIALGNIYISCIVFGQAKILCY